MSKAVKLLLYIGILSHDPTNAMISCSAIGKFGGVGFPTNVAASALSRAASFMTSNSALSNEIEGIKRAVSGGERHHIEWPESKKQKELIDTASCVLTDTESVTVKDTNKNTNKKTNKKTIKERIHEFIDSPAGFTTMLVAPVGIMMTVSIYMQLKAEMFLEEEKLAAQQVFDDDYTPSNAYDLLYWCKCLQLAEEMGTDWKELYRVHQVFKTREDFMTAEHPIDVAFAMFELDDD